MAKRLKKNLVFLLAIVLMLPGMGTTALAVESGTNNAEVAQNGENKYAKLADAIDAAKDNDTIVLLEDVNENITINKSLTLDLNGRTLTGDGTGSVMKISGDDLDVTIKNGTITGGYETSYGGGVNIQSSSSKVTLDNCVIEGNDASNAGGGIYAAATGEGGLTIVLKNVTIVDNKAGNLGGGVYITGSSTSFIMNGGTTSEAGSRVYNNTAGDAGDDIYFSSDGNTGKMTLPAATTITGWYHDGRKLNETTGKLETAARWKDGSTDEYTPEENDTTPVALKAAHPKMCTLTYVVSGAIPEGYTVPSLQTLVCNGKYTVAETPSSISGTKDGSEGTFSFTGWTTKDGAALTGEQTLTEDTTLYGVWTFTAKKSSDSSGTESGSTPTPDSDPTPTPTPDSDPTPDLTDDGTVAENISPQTGENSAITLPTALMILSGIGLAVLLLGGKKTQKLTK